MNNLLRKIILRTALVGGMLGACWLCMQTALYRSAEVAPAPAQPVSAQPDLVIVLDAGHGEST